ncbi:MAG TPA: CPBP family intramembrane glutamic endopeptidase, partial [Anaerolineae bacterium]
MAAFSVPEAPPATARPASSPAGTLAAGGALAGLALAEAATVWLGREVGLALYAGLLLALLVLAAAGGRAASLRRLGLGLATVPLLRVIGLGLPQPFLPPLIGLAAVALPLALGVAIALRRSEAPPSALGLNPAPGLQVLFWYPPLALTGFTLGVAEVLVLGKPPELPALSGLGLAAAALLLVLGVGFLEEIIFRGLVLQAIRTTRGGMVAVFYAALLGALLQLGTGSAGQVALTFVMGLWFGWVTLRSRTLYPAALA